MSVSESNLTKKQKEELNRLENVFNNLSDSDEYLERGDDNYVGSSVFIQYDSDNDDKILNDDLVDTTPYSADKYDSDDERLEVSNA
jgi:hypothetical protein